jgi:hypothetical protein
LRYTPVADTSRRVEITFEYDSPEEFTRTTQEMIPPVTNILKPHPPEVQRAA